MSLIVFDSGLILEDTNPTTHSSTEKNMKTVSKSPMMPLMSEVMPALEKAKFLSFAAALYSHETDTFIPELDDSCTAAALYSLAYKLRTTRQDAETSTHTAGLWPYKKEKKSSDDSETVHTAANYADILHTKSHALLVSTKCRNLFVQQTDAPLNQQTFKRLLWHRGLHTICFLQEKEQKPSNCPTSKSTNGQLIQQNLEKVVKQIYQTVSNPFQEWTLCDTLVAVVLAPDAAFTPEQRKQIVQHTLESAMITHIGIGCPLTMTDDSNIITGKIPFTIVHPLQNALVGFGAISHVPEFHVFARASIERLNVLDTLDLQDETMSQLNIPDSKLADIHPIIQLPLWQSLLHPSDHTKSKSRYLLSLLRGSSIQTFPEGLIFTGIYNDILLKNLKTSSTARDYYSNTPVFLKWLIDQEVLDIESFRSFPPNEHSYPHMVGYFGGKFSFDTFAAYKFALVLSDTQQSLPTLLNRYKKQDSLRDTTSMSAGHKDVSTRLASMTAGHKDVSTRLASMTAGHKDVSTRLASMSAGHKDSNTETTSISAGHKISFSERSIHGLPPKKEFTRLLTSYAKNAPTYEAYEQCTDVSKTFACTSNGPSIPCSRINDDICDCPNGIDEPGTSACASRIQKRMGVYFPGQQFWCIAGRYKSKESNVMSMSIPSQRQHLHIPITDKEAAWCQTRVASTYYTESNKPANMEIPPQSSSYIPSSYVGDGICDCIDGQDEIEL